MDRNKRQIETEQVIDIPKQMAEENLMVGLIKEFANLQNIAQITACLPIPRAVGESIPWGILTMNLTKLEYGNETVDCKQEPRETWELQKVKVGEESPVYSTMWECKGRFVAKPGLEGDVGNKGWCYYPKMATTNTSVWVTETKCEKKN